MAITRIPLQRLVAGLITMAAVALTAPPAIAQPTVIPVSGTEMAAALTENYSTVATMPLGEGLPALAEAVDGSSLDTAEVRSLSQGEALAIAAQIPPIGPNVQRLVAAVGDQAFILDRLLLPDAAVLAFHLAPTGSFSGSLVPNLMTLSATLDGDDLLVEYAGLGILPGSTVVNSEVFTCSQRCTIMEVAFIVGGAVICTVAGAVTGIWTGLLCSVGTGMVISAWAKACNADCFGENPDALMAIDSIICSATQCSVRAEVVVGQDFPIHGGAMLAEWQRLRSNTKIFTFHSMTIYQNLQNVSYTAQGNAHDNQGTPVNCTVVFTVHASVSNNSRGVVAADVASSQKAFDPTC